MAEEEPPAAAVALHGCALFPRAAWVRAAAAALTASLLAINGRSGPYRRSVA